MVATFSQIQPGDPNAVKLAGAEIEKHRLHEHLNRCKWHCLSTVDA